MIRRVHNFVLILFLLVLKVDQAKAQSDRHNAGHLFRSKQMGTRNNEHKGGV
jgi:hypothetical protein